MAENKPAVSTRPEDKIALTTDFGTLYVKRLPNGQLMRPVKATMVLHESKGQLYRVSSKWAITNDGYKYLNKVASVSLVTPQNISVDGHNRPSPMVERDEDTKVILTANVRKMGIGYSPAGNIVVVDKTLYYNVYTYFIQSIQAKMNKRVYDEKAHHYTDTLKHPNAARIGTKDDRPEENGRWTFLPTAPPLGLWINYLDPAIQECLEEHTQRQRFGDRIAQTIVERNILKSHPAIAVGQVDASGNKGYHTASVNVYGWRHEMGPEAMEEVMQQAERGQQVKVEVEVVSETIEPEPEEEAAAVEEVAEEEEAEGKHPPLFKGDPATTDPEKEG